MNEIAGVISARGRAALSLRDLFYDAAPARAQIFTHAADAWRCSERPIDDLITSGTHTRAALGMLTYHAEARSIAVTSRPALPIVLKGRIANFRSLKKHLVAAGCASACDDEPTVVARLMQFHLAKGETAGSAARAALSRLQGFIAFIAAPDSDGKELIAASNGAELFLRFDQDAAIAFSDPRAVRPRDAMMALRAGDVASLNTDCIGIVDADGMQMEKRSRPTGVSAPVIGGG